ncbi:MAG: hypothetical protein ABIG89_03800 [Candidatus Woesearchaeota archaeon]
MVDFELYYEKKRVSPETGELSDSVERLHIKLDDPSQVDHFALNKLKAADWVRKGYLDRQRSCYADSEFNHFDDDYLGLNPVSALSEGDPGYDDY